MFHRIYFIVFILTQNMCFYCVCTSISNGKKNKLDCFYLYFKPLLVWQTAQYGIGVRRRCVHGNEKAVICATRDPHNRFL